MGKNLGRERQQFTLWYRRRPQCCSHLRRLVSGLFKHALCRASVLCRSGLKHAVPCGSQEIFAINAEKSKLNLPGKPSIKGSAPLSVPEWRGLDQLVQTKGSALLPSGIAKLPWHMLPTSSSQDLACRMSDHLVFLALSRGMRAAGKAVTLTSAIPLLAPWCH